MGTFGEITLDRKISRYCPFKGQCYQKCVPDGYTSTYSAVDKGTVQLHNITEQNVKFTI